MDKSITADWARQTSEEIFGKKVEEQINKCENAIKNAVASNKFSCTVGLLLEERAKKELERRGFRLIKHNSNHPMESDYYEIHW